MDAGSSRPGNTAPPDGGADEGESLFGYTRVTPDEKRARVRGVFDSVAARYDLMNDLMSGGLHRAWKRYAVALLGARPGHRVLDVAGGTGDLSRLIATRTRGEAQVVCCDINAEMLNLGRDRVIDAGIARGVEFVQADAEALPFADRSVDRVIIGFGLRNVTRKSRALEEFARVLVPGGRVVVLEFSHPRHALLGALYDRYSFAVLPRIGALVADDADSYRYLAESIRVHPDQEALRVMMQKAGLESVRCHNLLGGVVAVHVASRY